LLAEHRRGPLHQLAEHLFAHQAEAVAPEFDPAQHRRVVAGEGRRVEQREPVAAVGGGLDLGALRVVEVGQQRVAAKGPCRRSVSAIR